MTEWFKAGLKSNFPENESIILEDTPFGEVIIIQQKGIFHALNGICSHEYFELGGCPVQEGQITCPLHLSAFDLSTGKSLNPPAEDPLTVFNVKIDNEIVWIKKE